MKRFAWKFGDFYLSLYPDVSGVLDPFSCHLFDSAAAARSALPDITKKIAPHVVPTTVGETVEDRMRLVQFTIVEHDAAE